MDEHSAQDENNKMDTTPLPVSLNPEVIESRNLAPEIELPQIFQKIVQERGNFRDLDETELEKQLEEEEDSSKAFSGKQDPYYGFTILPSQQEGNDVSQNSMNIHDYKKELVDYILIAQNECSLALDMTSLLLSKYKQSSSDTISPFLKSTVPPGSLGLERCHPPEAKESDSILAMCWKRKSLTSSKNLLFDAKERLSKVVDSEREYFQILSNVRDSSWPLVLSNKGGNYDVSVQYSALGGISLGLGLVRKDQEKQSYNFESGLVHQKASLRVDLVSSTGKIIASSKWNWSWGIQEEEDQLLVKIQSAQRVLLEMDVWNALLQEAQICENQGVVFTGDTIVLSCNPEFSLRIFLDTNTEESRQDPEADFLNVDQEEEYDYETKKLSQRCCDAVNAITHILFLQYCRNPNRKLQQAELAMVIDASAPQIIRPLIFYYAIHEEARQFQNWLQNEGIKFEYLPSYPWESAQDFLTFENFLLTNRLSLQWYLDLDSSLPAHIQHNPTLHGTEKTVWKYKDAYNFYKFSSVKNMCQYIEHARKQRGEVASNAIQE
ncbi:mediator complex subunit Srb4 [Schizosaccharomyces cryophilus OY26]|uniref:Mediator of RNA polymerase II transcription subunit 17 n=1 Tax=Schizosaccharomyces cryophilus (strain OY26 / ATCC MYA-4695 / CBS 11777 / NBRC 106824 / NRRL Y48691) TaxID=653667 RepID=S9W156_SCHCR|nr:mediator complex subunit Srb4 [Schizosaccharomyces cryophilus OY26]EPY53673.1 mediator complex subunit Srb4 [Schizosaccharomyces cryophilus OY26]